MTSPKHCTPDVLVSSALADPRASERELALASALRDALDEIDAMQTTINVLRAAQDAPRPST